MKTPLTARKLRQHFGYRWWQYLVIVVLCVLGFNLIFTTTAPRAADDEKVELYVYGYGDEGALRTWMEYWRQTEYPEQEEFSTSFISPDESSGLQVMMTRFAVAGEGELAAVPKDLFQSYAEQGVFEPLEEKGEVMLAYRRYGIDTEKGRWPGPDGQMHIYGIPVSGLPVLNGILYGQAGEFCVCIHIRNGNEDVTERVLCSMIRDMHSLEQAASVEAGAP